MTILGPETIKAIRDHEQAKRKRPRRAGMFTAESARAARLVRLQKESRAYQIRQMASDGYGWEDVMVELKVSREIAKAAVFGAKRCR